MRAAEQALSKLQRGVKVAKENPIQLHTCPWCGTPLDHRNYYVTSDRSRLVVQCRKEGCEFKDRLPVYVVDSEFYEVRPSLIIATADKFATLPWKEETAALFNLPDGQKPAADRPELIIQDELHLISGPLGTLAGLYETAIDALATQDGVPPKVIASTATIRRADAQGRALFAREVKQFPPPGLTSHDSFFATRAPRDSRGSRCYVGVMAPATSPTTLMIRTYAALLQAVYESREAFPPEVLDAYWTLVGYFNSLRVLGGAVLQVRDDVDDRMKLLSARHRTAMRRIGVDIELTSRLTATEIPERLGQMSKSYPSPESPDVVLATNMISVGVDVDRLGLMAVMGQPQSTSEYIQATSRVGRQHPGLIVTMLNSARSRDRSHYESFVAYHSALYRQVESTSVTPFSPRARDRGLHAVLIALTRLLIKDFRANNQARRIRSEPAKVDAIVQLILQRVERVRPEERASTEQQLGEILDRWRDLAGPSLEYWSRNPAESLLWDAAACQNDSAEGFPTLWSLRDVDAESGLYLIRAHKPAVGGSV